MNTIAERWPLFVLTHTGALRARDCIFISTKYDFKIHQRDDLVWFSRGGRAIIWGPLDELGVEWLDLFEKQIAAAIERPLRPRGGKFPAAACILGLARDGASYFTAIDRYNSNKPRAEALLARLEENCARVVALIGAIRAAVPGPIADELAPAAVYARALPPNNMFA